MSKLEIRKMENTTFPASKAPHRLSFDEAVEVWLLTEQGEFKHRIASRFDVNVGRIYDVYHGKLHPESKVVADYVLRSQKSH